MVDPEQFAEGVAAGVRAHNRRLEERYGVSETVPPEEAAAEYCEYAKRLAPYLVDGSVLVGEALEAGKTVLCEGAQGLLLDLDHGSYPYVTSSSVIAGGALTGLGFGPKEVSRVIGVGKAYTTRVGAGPFPTELLDEIGDQLRGTGDNPWDEYGTTTGRPRRCGWLDLVILRYAVRVNGLDELMLVKLDVLSGLEELKVAVAYERDGERIEHFPAEFGLDALAEWKPVYETVPGWTEDITKVRKMSDLPTAAQDYVALIERQVGVPVTSVSVGPERNQVVTP
jgi:adenylosuccinate synthase